ncbi:MAG: hypothetical protein JXA15_03690 [Spirochaetales bacterium]|nr:hypothetical protein [Spirochaetales bacterium]
MLENLWYTSCYGLSLAAWLGILLGYLRRREARTFWFLLLFTGFSAVSLSISLGASLEYADPTDGRYKALNALSLAAFPFFLLSIPRFFRTFGAGRGQRAIDAVSAALAATSAVLPVLLYLPLPEGAFAAVLAPHVAALAAAVLYALASLARLGRRPQSRDDAGWTRFARWSLLPLALIFPLVVASDILQLPRILIGFDPPRFLPLLAALVGLAYLRAQAPRDAGAAAIHPKARAASGVAPEAASFDRFGLSRREREVAELLLDGFSYREIADRLFVSHGTVKTHVLSVYRKTGARTKLSLLKALAPAGGTGSTEG